MHIISINFSLHGQLTNEFQNGTAIARTYDALNRPTGYRLMRNGGASPPGEPLAVSYAYDALGRLAVVDLNAEAQSRGVGFEYSYLSNADLISGKTATLGNHSPFTILHSNDNNVPAFGTVKIVEEVAPNNPWELEWIKYFGGLNVSLSAQSHYRKRGKNLPYRMLPVYVFYDKGTRSAFYPRQRIRLECQQYCAH